MWKFMTTPFETFLRQHDEESWSATLTTLLRSIHEVDRNATQIWFSFYPLSLFQALEQSDDPETLQQRLLMQGTYYLKDQIDSSHTFLYGHRYWPEVKSAVQKNAREFSDEDARSLTDQILAVAEQVKVDQSLVIGITAVAFMLLAKVLTTLFGTFVSDNAIRLIRWKDNLRRIAIAAFISTVGWVAAFIHLYIFDKRFLSLSTLEKVKQKNG